MIKNEIRRNENVIPIVAPIQRIHNAFQLFSIGGPRADAVYNHWNIYFVNHHHYLEEINDEADF